MAFCAGPTNYFWGGTWLGVSTKCDNKSLAKQFVEFFTTNADTMKKYTEFTGDFCNNKTVMKDIAEERQTRTYSSRMVRISLQFSTQQLKASRWMV